jgi:hypothetical protein
MSQAFIRFARRGYCIARDAATRQMDLHYTELGLKMNVTHEFNRKIPWPVRLMIVCGLALLFAFEGYPRLAVVGWAAGLKLRGKAPECSWTDILNTHGRLTTYAELRRSASAALQVQEYDSQLKVELIRTPRRSFWIKRSGDGAESRELLAYLLAEHDWLIQENPKQGVQPGDIVLDCGAHVGTFAHLALQRGAAKVVAIEPDRSCKRRVPSAQLQERNCNWTDDFGASGGLEQRGKALSPC